MPSGPAKQRPVRRAYCAAADLSALASGCLAVYATVGTTFGGRG